MRRRYVQEVFGREYRFPTDASKVKEIREYMLAKLGPSESTDSQQIVDVVNGAGMKGRTNKMALMVLKALFRDDEFVRAGLVNVNLALDNVTVPQSSLLDKLGFDEAGIEWIEFFGKMQKKYPKAWVSDGVEVRWPLSFVPTLMEERKTW